MSKSKAKVEKKEMQKNIANLEPVFRFQVIGEDRVMCKYVNTIESRDKLFDDPIELEEPGGVFSFPDQGNYQIVGRACTCNIPGGFLLKNKKMPVYYLSLLYASQLVTGSMFNYFLYFTIDDETSEKLLLPKNYINKLMSGKFTLELMDAEGFLTFFIKNKRPEIEDQIIESYLEKFDLASSDEEKEAISTEIKLEVEARLDKFRELFEPITVTGTFTRIKILKRMQEFFAKPDFDELIKSCLQFTQKERFEKMGGGKQMTLPKRVLNLKDCLDDPEKIDEYVNNMPDSESDSESESECEHESEQE